MNQTWIFQGNPDEFDMDGYLHACRGDLLWLVKRYGTDIAVGDTVFLWRSAGRSKETSGVIAECIVVEPVKVQADDVESRSFWKKNPDQAKVSQPRVRLRLLKLANKKEVLNRKWLLEDKALKDLAVIRQPQGTNFPVTDDQLPRLRSLWDNTGRDWNRAEVVAALYLYEGLLGQPIARTEDSPVAEIAEQIGRATTGVYNKLMNFRSLDPRAPQAGLKGSSEADKAVWAEFFNIAKGSLDFDRLEREYRRLWGAPKAPVESEAYRAAVEEQAQRLETKGLDRLLKDYRASRRSKALPVRKKASTTIYERDPQVVAITKLRADHRCEVANCANHSFEGADGDKYVETHHLIPLAEGGPDEIENTAALCAIHHRELHYGINRRALTKGLQHMRGVKTRDTD